MHSKDMDNSDSVADENTTNESILKKIEGTDSTGVLLFQNSDRDDTAKSEIVNVVNTTRSPPTVKSEFGSISLLFPYSNSNSDDTKKSEILNTTNFQPIVKSEFCPSTSADMLVKANHKQSEILSSNLKSTPRKAKLWNDIRKKSDFITKQLLKIKDIQKKNHLLVKENEALKEIIRILKKPIDCESESDTIC